MRAPYSIKDQDPSEIDRLAERCGLDRTLAKILLYRGYDSPEKIELFLNPHLSDLHSPFLMSGMYQAVARIKSAISSGERIGIFADSDIDGIAALAVLHALLTRMKIYPHIRYLKNDETYGITKEIVDEFHSNDVALLITVDSGIRDTSEIAYAVSLGIDVIVSDHHEQDSVLPNAIILNPKTEACAYPFKHLAGVGIAFKLCHALLLSFLPSFNKLFLIITREDGRYCFSAVRNCILEEVRTSAAEEEITRILEAADKDDIVLLYNIDRGTERIFHSSSLRCRINDFCEFVSGIMKQGETGLEGICSHLKIGRRAALINTLAAVFMETQASAPGRIYDFIRSVIGLVSLGSIADVMPLIGENRALTKLGIQELNRDRPTALSLLIGDEKINGKTIGWRIAPMLNTPGRLGRTELTFDFFIENDEDRLKSVISEIGVLNDGRKSMIQKLVAKILADMESGTRYKDDNVIYLKTDEVPDGYAGLIANRIADTVGKPVILVVLPGKNGIVKGSCRIKNGQNFFSHVVQYSEKFERIGGHEKAFGFTAKALNVDDLIKSIIESYRHVPENNSGTNVDSELDIKKISVNLIRGLEIFEPYGNENPEPVFISRGLLPEQFSVFGNHHGRYFFSCNPSLSAVGWGMAQTMKDFFECRRPLDIIYRLENNEYNGRVRPRMILVDILSPEE